jgi:hypothetical protein
LSRYSGNIIKYEFIWKKVFKTGAESWKSMTYPVKSFFFKKKIALSVLFSKKKKHVSFIGYWLLVIITA